MQRPIHLFIVDDNRISAEAVGSLLSDHKEILLGGSTADPDEALRQIQSDTIDVVLINATIGRFKVIQLAQNVKDQCEKVKIVVLGLAQIEESILEIIEAGVSGYLLRDASFAELVSIVKAVHCEQTPCSPRIAASVFARISRLSRERRQRGAIQLEKLTPRENEILSLVAAGLANKEIASRLSISLFTVKNHVHNILEKLHVHYRRDAISYAYRGDHSLATRQSSWTQD